MAAVKNLNSLVAAQDSVGNWVNVADSQYSAIRIAIVSGGGGGGGGAGSVNFSAGTTSNNLASIVYGDANGLSFGLNGSTITGSYTVPSTAGLISLVNLSAGTTSNNLTNFVFSDANNVSFGLNGSTITASATVATSLSNIKFSAGTSSANLSALTFSNSNNVSFGLNGSTVTGSASFPAQTVQTQSLIAGLYDGANSISTGTARLSNANGISFGINGQTITASHNGLTSQSNQAFSADASSTFQTLSFQNSNLVSFSNNAGAIRITHDLMASSSRPAFSANGGSSTFQTLSFGNTNGLTWSNTNGSVGLASLNLSLFAVSNTTQSSSGTANHSAISFAGAGIASVGVTGGSVVISVPTGAPSPVNFSAGAASGNLGSVVFSNSNGVSFGLNGSTITASVDAGGGGGFTAPGVSPYDDFVQVVGQVGQGTLQLDPQILPNVSFDRFMVYLQNTNSSNSSGSHSIRFSIGLYTRNGSSLSLYTSYAGSTAVTHSGTAGSYSLFSGKRLFPVTFAATSIPANKYWIGFVSSTASAGANGTYSNYLVSNLNTNYTGLFGVAANATMQPKLGQGYYTASTTALPNSIGFNQINGTASMAARFPVIGLGSSTV